METVSTEANAYRSDRGIMLCSSILGDTIVVDAPFSIESEAKMRDKRCYPPKRATLVLSYKWS